MKFIKYIILSISLLVSIQIWAQSGYGRSIFNNGVACMQQGKYSEAIGCFNAAMVSDKSLEQECRDKIEECNKLMKNRKKAKQVKKEVVQERFIDVLEKSFTFGAADSKTDTIHIKQGSAIDWKCSCDADWVTLEGYNNNTIAVKCEENKSIDVRTATVTVYSGELKATLAISQEGAEEIFEIDTKPLHFYKKGGSEFINVIKSNSAWEVHQKPEWIEVVITNDGKQIVVVAEESDEKRRNDNLLIRTKSGAFTSIIAIEQSGSALKQAMNNISEKQEAKKKAREEKKNSEK